MNDRKILQEMSDILKLNFVLILTLVVSISLNTSSQTNKNLSKKLNVSLINQEILKANKERIKSGDKNLLSSFNKLYSFAEIGLTKGPYSVTQKNKIPPSGNKHDYLSLGPYWWPDPDKKDGLPYIRKDGVVNPEVFEFTDKKLLVEMCVNVKITALAYYLTDEQRFAEHAVNLLKVWFVDDDTKMNPNFKFGQAIPGISVGRAVGLIEARHFTEVIDAIGLIQNSIYWNEEINNKIFQWFYEYFTWLIESELGKEESSALNNHGSWYDVQAASIALFLGKNEFAKDIIEKSKIKRINIQIEPDGRQPEELARTRSLSYSTFNLEALFSLAQLGKFVGIDLWSYESEEGSSLKKAFNFLLPFYFEEKEWPYKQITDFEYQRSYALLLQAANNYDDNKYKQLADSLNNQYIDDLGNILFKKLN